MGQNVKMRAGTLKCEPKHDKASRNMKTWAEMWKCESKRENTSRNVKTRDKMWKREPKRENVSRNISQLTWIDLKGPWLTLIDLYWPYLMKLRINGKNHLGFEAFLRKSNKSIDQKSSSEVANTYT